MDSSQSIADIDMEQSLQKDQYYAWFNRFKWTIKEFLKAIYGILLISDLREIVNVLLFDIVDDNENGRRECLDEDVREMDIDAKAILSLLMYSMIVLLSYFTIFYDS